jgi:hypothetical protein
MERDIRQHVREERLEAYAMHSMGAEETATVEEHLLFCTSCQDQLEAVERYVRVMAGAAKRIRVDEAKAPVTRGALHWLRTWLRTPAPMWTAALVMGALILMVGIHLRVPPGAPVEVELQAVRGAAAATAQPGHALHLKLDIRGIPDMPAWPIEIVDENGSKIWTGAGTRSDGTIKVSVDKSFQQGSYFVRLLKDGDDPVREYQLVVR